MSAPESDVLADWIDGLADALALSHDAVEREMLRRVGVRLRGALAGQQERIATILTDEERAAVNYTAVVLESDHFAWKDCEVLRGLLKRDAALRGGPSDKEPSRE